MAAKCESLFLLQMLIESRPLPDLRITPIRSYHPPCPHFDATGANNLPRHLVHNGPPQKFNPGGTRSLHKNLVQGCPSYSDGFAVREPCFHGKPPTHKPDTAEREPGLARNFNSQLCQSSHCIRHQSFPTRFVDGGRHTVRNDNRQSALSRSQCHRQACGSASRYENI